MPKIIYRPNPVPPPFVPPSPDYPENSISFSPSTFNVGQNVVATIHKVTTSPETTKVSLYLSNTTQGEQTILDIPVEPNYIDNLQVTFSAEFAFEDYLYATIFLWNGVEYETEIQLSLVP